MKINTLDDLHQAIKDGAIELSDDLEMPWAREKWEPKDTSEVWAWDEDRVLVGTCAHDAEIIPRWEWYELTDHQTRVLTALGRLEQQTGKPVTAKSLAEACELDRRSGGFQGVLARFRDGRWAEQVYPKGPWTVLRVPDDDKYGCGK